MILVYHPGVTTIPESRFGVMMILGTPPGVITTWGQRPEVTTSMRSLWFWTDHDPGNTTIPQETEPPLRPPSPPWGQPCPAVTAVWGPPAPSAASALRSPRQPWRPLAAPTAAPPRPLPPRGGGGSSRAVPIAAGQGDASLVSGARYRGFTEVCVCDGASPPVGISGFCDGRCHESGVARAGSGGGAGAPAGGACRKV